MNAVVDEDEDDNEIFFSPFITLYFGRDHRDTAGKKYKSRRGRKRSGRKRFTRR